jgi:hypothetical protein
VLQEGLGVEFNPAGGRGEALRRAVGTRLGIFAIAGLERHLHAARRRATGWPTSSRNGGRHQIGTVADITSVHLAGLNRNPHGGAVDGHACSSSPRVTAWKEKERCLCVNWSAVTITARPRVPQPEAQSFSGPMAACAAESQAVPKASGRRGREGWAERRAQWLWPS